ncbi:hypothetical protein ACFOGI_12470 [Virgibacillus xinjiangensis]|uniref:Uncharacterized protein n=1 Tax=Virgibacillus xinjiangensis TaxID=393090 RepID=A0ABV7CXR7_9BACI
MLIVESMVIWQLEEGIQTYWEALYITGSRIILFGREMPTIEHKLSVLLLTGTSIMGVVIQGVALQWGFSTAENRYKKWKNRKMKPEANKENL